MKAVIYARVSTEEQLEGYSVDAQLRAGHDWATQHGHTVIAEYVDEGKSAKSLTKRLRLQELLEEAKLKKFDLVIIHKLDRLSRNLSDALAIMGAFEATGITLVSVSESFDFTTPIGRMVF